MRRLTTSSLIVLLFAVNLLAETILATSPKKRSLRNRAANQPSPPSKNACLTNAPKSLWARTSVAGLFSVIPAYFVY